MRRKLKKKGDKISVTAKASQQGGKLQEFSDLFTKLDWILTFLFWALFKES